MTDVATILKVDARAELLLLSPMHVQCSTSVHDDS